MTRGLPLLLLLPPRVPAAGAHGAARRAGGLYQIKGPWGVNSPLHENLALLSLRDALSAGGGNATAGLLASLTPSGGVAQLPARGDRGLMPVESAPGATQELLRGVVWPDDPGGFLFDRATGTADYGSGASWGRAFTADPADPDNLVARAHHGDLSFMHSMAERDGEKAWVTKGNIVRWSRFLIDVAGARVAPNTALQQTAVSVWFARQGSWAVRKLLLGEKHHGDAVLTDAQTRQRAAGALLHLIEDSYSYSHAERDHNASGAVVQFHAYPGQDADKHGAADSPREGGSLGAVVDRTGGAGEAVAAGTRALLAVDRGDEPTALLESLFRLSPRAVDAGPGAAYRKEPDDGDDDGDSVLAAVLFFVAGLMCAGVVVGVVMVCRRRRGAPGQQRADGAAAAPAAKDNPLPGAFPHVPPPRAAGGPGAGGRAVVGQVVDVAWGTSWCTATVAGVHGEEYDVVPPRTTAYDVVWADGSTARVPSHLVQVAS